MDNKLLLLPVAKEVEEEDVVAMVAFDRTTSPAVHVHCPFICTTTACRNFLDAVAKTAVVDDITTGYGRDDALGAKRLVEFTLRMLPPSN